MVRWLLTLALLIGAGPVSAAVDSGPHQCLTDAAKHYGVDWRIVRAIRKVEGGWNGARMRNKNGTHDHGVMQINTIWMKNKALVASGITEQAITNSECVAYWTGTWIYALELARTGGDAWRAAGNYHSKTPVHHDRYLGLVKAAYLDLFGTLPPEANRVGPPVDEQKAFTKRCAKPSDDDRDICEAWELALSLENDLAVMSNEWADDEEARLAGVQTLSDEELDRMVEQRLAEIDRGLSEAETLDALAGE